MTEMSDTNPGGSGVGASSVTARRDHDCGDGDGLMEAVVGRENMTAAYKRVAGNRGSAGVDRMSVEELKPYLDEHWERIKSELLEDGYRPQPVRQVEIPKPGGGVRKLGIPTVIDRLIGQALHQVLEPIFDPCFSESSYGFRHGRSAHQAVEQARKYVVEGYRWVVDIDLEKFFDRVSHDILMSRIARREKDKRVLRVVRRYLQAGIMTEGIVSARYVRNPARQSAFTPIVEHYARRSG